MSDLSSSS